MKLPERTFAIFNRKVVFSQEDVQKYDSIGLKIGADIVEYCLMGIGINGLSPELTDGEVRSLCTKALDDYASVVKETTVGLAKDGFFNEH